jgi:hypothetical protein
MGDSMTVIERPFLSADEAGVEAESARSIKRGHRGREENWRKIGRGGEI